MTQKRTSSPTYLIRNPHSYCFRLRIPLGLQNVIGRKELRYSLKTGYLGKAKSRARTLAGLCQMIFDFLIEEGMKKLTRADVRYMINSTIRSFIDQIEYKRAIGIKSISAIHDQNKLDEIESRFGVKLPPPIKANMTLNGMANIGNLLTTLSLKNSQLDMFKGSIKVLLKAWGLDYNEDSVEYKIIGRDYIKALNNWAKVEQNRNDGNYTDSTESLFSIPPESELSFLAEKVKGNAKPSNDSLLISEIVKRYAQENKKSWKAKSYEEIVKDSLGLFIEIIGDKAIQAITRRMISDFKNTISKLPPRRNISPEYRCKTIPQLLQMEVETVMAPRTINKHLGRVGTLFNFAKDNGYYQGDNPATNMNVPLDDDADDKRAAYTTKDLTNIFHSEGYSSDNFSRSYMFWTPIIALFHGMRQNEIAQLHLSDIRQEKGVWVFDVNSLMDKKVKTKTSRRLVPIHPFLLEELRLLDLMKSLADDGHDRLFPEITPGRDGYGQAVSKWYNERFRHRIEFEPDQTDRWKDFHSFRKTFITAMAYKDVSDKKIKQVVGHSRGNDVTNRNYIENFAGEKLLEDVLMKIDFHKELDLSHLKNSKWVGKP